MEQKIKVEICVGTTCFLLGASELQYLERYLPEDLTGKVEVLGCNCLEFCHMSKVLNSAPFVRLNGSEIMSNASVDKIVNRIRELLDVEV